MKIKILGNPPPFVKEFIEFQMRMPQIQMGKVPEDVTEGSIAVSSIPLNSFIAAFMNEIWDHKEKYLGALAQNVEGQVSDQDKMQILWNTMAGFMESVAAQFGWNDPLPRA